MRVSGPCTKELFPRAAVRQRMQVVTASRLVPRVPSQPLFFQVPCDVQSVCRGESTTFWSRGILHSLAAEPPPLRVPAQKQTRRTLLNLAPKRPASSPWPKRLVFRLSAGIHRRHPNPPSPTRPPTPSTDPTGRAAAAATNNGHPLCLVGQMDRSWTIRLE